MVDERLKLAEQSLNEAKEYISKGNPVQASEKIYKVVEECIKILAEKNRLSEYEEAQREGRWWTHLFSRAARNLSVKLKEEKFLNIWAKAYDLHVWGFHEHKLRIDEVAPDLSYAEWILDYTKNST